MGSVVLKRDGICVVPLGVCPWQQSSTDEAVEFRVNACLFE
jgi:hypothetical protein